MFLREIGRVLMVGMLAILSWGCGEDRAMMGASPEEMFLEAFQEERYAEALRIADRRLERDASSGIWHMYRGMTLVLSKRPEEALEAFRMAEVCGGGEWMDRTGLHLRAQALLQAKAYARAQQVLDILTRHYPTSRLAGLAQAAALRIEKRLSEGLSESDVEWNLARGMRAHEGGRPSLAVEYLEEYLLLASRREIEDMDRQEKAEFTLGTAYLELGDERMALSHLNRVVPEHADYAAALLTAIALRGVGDTDAAIALLRKVSGDSADPETTARALRYLAEWSAN